MLIYIVIALLNGGVVCVGCMVNGRLDPERASLWNRLNGLLFLTILSVLFCDWQRAVQVTSPMYACVGGILGALLVAANSFALSQFEATLSMLMTVCSQMLTAVLFDILQGGTVAGRLRCLGVAAVLAGLYLNRGISSLER
ncbi:DMT family transporter [Burkholderia stagnalis]|uniref:DMT family transporter n=1 Tax=Burkholderia stagnalis TaxID=1503054 RepID=UPI00075FBF9E|nr:DMT family transporter [Burkholderia stagnalis]MDY7806674.1 DMT family transporter [Burkholderia stagnalis]